MHHGPILFCKAKRQYLGRYCRLIYMPVIVTVMFSSTLNTGNEKDVVTKQIAAHRLDHWFIDWFDWTNIPDHRALNALLAER